MPSRFNQLIEPNKYVSQYVPLPLELIAAEGDKLQKEMDLTKAKISSESSPLEKFNVAASLKTYSDNAIKDIDVGYNDRKNQLINDINKKSLDISNKLASGELSPKSPEIYNLHREALAAANELQSYQETAKKMNEANAEIMKSGDYSKQQYLGNPLLEYNQEVLQKIKNGEDVNYNPVGIAKYTDKSKEVSEYASKVGVDQLASYIGTDKRPGYIYEYSKKGRTKNKIESGFDSWYDNSIVKDDISLSVKHQAKLAGVNLTDKIPVSIPQYDDNGKFIGMQKMEVEFGEYHEALAKQNLLDQAKTQSTSEIGQSMSADWKYQRALDEEASKRDLSSTVAPGTTNVDKTMIGGKPVSEYLKKDASGNIERYSPNHPDVLSGKAKAGEAIVDYSAFVDAFKGDLTPAAAKSMFIKALFGDAYSAAKEAKQLSTLDTKEFNEKIVLFGKSMGLTSVGETLEYLQNASVSANPIILPSTEVAKGLDLKIIQQFGKDQMKTSDGVSILELAGDKGTSSFQGLDLSDKQNPRFKFEITSENGVKSYATTDIPNKNYVAALKPIAEIAADVSDIQLGRSKINPDEIRSGATAISIIRQSRPDIMKDLGIQNAVDVTPISSKQIVSYDNKGNPVKGTLFVYNDNNNIGNVMAVEVLENGEISAAPNFADYISTKIDNEFIFPIVPDVLSKERQDRENRYKQK